MVTAAEFIVWGVRTDGASGEGEVGANIESAFNNVRYRVRRVGLERIDTSWELQDDGEDFDIVGITQNPTFHGTQYIDIHCLRRV